jgi:hypothetical protein
MMALMIVLGGTFASVSFTLMWGFSNRRPAKAHPSLTGRHASPYWHSATGLQDERGIARWPDRADLS